MNEKKRNPPIQEFLLNLVDNGLHCLYVKFNNPVSPAKGMEPVYEFKIETVRTKYTVDSIIYTPYGVLFKSGQEKGLVPLDNVTHARPV